MLRMSVNVSLFTSISESKCQTAVNVHQQKPTLLLPASTALLISLIPSYTCRTEKKQKVDQGSDINLDYLKSMIFNSLENPQPKHLKNVPSIYGSLLIFVSNSFAQSFSPQELVRTHTTESL